MRERWDRTRSKRVLKASKKLVRAVPERSRRVGLSKRRVRAAVGDSIPIPVAYAGIALMQGHPQLAAINMLAIPFILPFNLVRAARAERTARREVGPVTLQRKINDLQNDLDKLRAELNEYRTPQTGGPTGGEGPSTPASHPAREATPRQRPTDQERTSRAGHEARDRGL